jgi:hypothetical protein
VSQLTLGRNNVIRSVLADSTDNDADRASTAKGRRVVDLTPSADFGG